MVGFSGHDFKEVTVGPKFGRNGSTDCDGAASDAPLLPMTTRSHQCDQDRGHSVGHAHGLPIIAHLVCSPLRGAQGKEGGSIA